ncbi:MULTISPECIES: gamma-glutamyltransferase family protein [unclassified Agrococcus]|uniref:gamma-glutamyltransferase family protein n=1 Tax=unclassified Agrococcus TaxID=2615065 RepID=UPI00361E7E45
MRTRPELHGTFGAVASTHWLASSAGMAVLERGGNAADAAVAAGFVLHVVEPHLNGPGGDLPAIVHEPGREPRVLCGQGVTPAGATIDAYRALGVDHVPGTGLLAAVVPGAVPAWMTLLRDLGTWTPAEVLAFAIDLADRGHHVLPRVAATIAANAERFRMDWPTSAELWVAGGAPEPWQRIRMPQLATTYRRLADAGAGLGREAACDAAIAAWREGFVAEAIDAHGRTAVVDATGDAHPGLLRGEDMAAWQPTWEAPLGLDWRGRRVLKCGAWTQGPALLAQLGIVEPLLPTRAERFDADVVHVATEAAKLAFADRDAWFGDGADISGLLDEAYLAQRRALIAETASLELRPGALHGPPRMPVVEVEGAHRAAGAGEPTRGDTCHLDVVDADGMVVSATPSGGWLQSSPAIEGLGFCLGTRAQMLWLEEGLTTSMAPGIRPRTTLSPSMALDDDGTVTAFGTPGGDQQDSWQVSMLLGMGVLGLEPQAAIDAPAWHTTHLVSSFDPRVWEPGGLHVEDRLGDDVIAELRRRGHRVSEVGAWSLGRLSLASRAPDGSVRAAANPRGEQGYAVAR